MITKATRNITAKAARAVARCTLNQDMMSACALRLKRAVLDRISLRGIERLFGLSRRTVVDWIEVWAERLLPLEATLAGAQAEDVLELGEVWSFVLKKANQHWVRGCLAPPHAPDCGLFHR